MSDFKAYLEKAFENVTLTAPQQPDDATWLDKQEPCPSCGAESTIIHVEFDDGDVWYRPECSQCNVGWKEQYPTVREAVEAWNQQPLKKRAHWKPLGQRTYGGGRCYTHYCSACGQHGYGEERYCPDCGSKMLE